ncbi:MULTISPECIES: branched-chain amino acid ABC transporter permease [Atopobiaceae]|uniref:Amino acid/amide ABC transporter membrane protein 2, HAAT family n=1 Tax=Parafannyhessea umbonata TaxID=604330 RepID=A0A1H6K0X1_9ACTN|nr:MULTISPECIES: branched-chain amino acid ABC transporter permease [Atopobiaceae]SEH68789.1 amino acid/amide ABC transporter membrane protein 2, HAAT family [Parafannyhessea umbonata]SJZ54045.1 amino acid/amide ABC transporter membrane protein 2, HAAT family (TC 3.A.1.4.-) [Olsenella sp. KH1P3]
MEESNLSEAVESSAASTSGSSRKKLSMPVRYLINAVLVAVFIVVGELMIGSGTITRYQTTVLEQVGIYILMAVSLNIATGYLGQLPLGHAGFMSVGGYSCALFIMHMQGTLGLTVRDFVTGSPAAVVLFCAGLLFGGVMAAICGLIIGIPALRLKGDYLAIITLGFAEIIRVVMLNIDGVLGFELTGGARGLTGIPSYTNFLNTFLVVVISLFLIHTMMKSRHGRAILAIRDNEIAAEASGVHTTYYKTLAFVVSAFFAGIAGGLYAGCIGVMAPAKFGFMKSIEILVMVVLGGMGSMLGSVLSATVLTILPEALRAFADYRMVVYAVVLIIVMIFRPQGLLGTYDFSLTGTLERVINGELPWRKPKKEVDEND